MKHTDMWQLLGHAARFHKTGFSRYLPGSRGSAVLQNRVHLITTILDYLMQRLVSKAKYSIQGHVTSIETASPVMCMSLCCAKSPGTEKNLYRRGEGGAPIWLTFTHITDSGWSDISRVVKSVSCVSANRIWVRIMLFQGKRIVLVNLHTWNSVHVLMQERQIPLP